MLLNSICESVLNFLKACTPTPIKDRSLPWLQKLHPKRTTPDLPAFRPLHSASPRVPLRSDGSETAKTGGEGFVRFSPGFSRAFNLSRPLAMSVGHLAVGLRAGPRCVPLMPWRTCPAATPCHRGVRLAGGCRTLPEPATKSSMFTWRLVSLCKK